MAAAPYSSDCKPAKKSKPASLVGIGYRVPLASWIESQPSQIDCLEVTAENFYRQGGGQRLQELAKHYPLIVHSLGLSVGTPGPLRVRDLDRLSALVEQADPLWVSDHASFCRTEELELGHFAPLCPDQEMLSLVADHAAEVKERCGRPFLLENVTSHLRVRGRLSETDFLNRLCERSGCGLLLDLTNLHVNACNHGFDSRSWLRDLDPQYVVQFHVVGYTSREGRCYDQHAEAIQADLWSLIEDAFALVSPRAAVIERDRNFPEPSELAGELQALRELTNGPRSRGRRS